MWEKLLPSTEDPPRPGSLSSMPDRGPFAETTREATPASSATTQLTPSAGAPANETFLATSAKEIRISRRRGRWHAIGRLLAEVKARVGHAQWLLWVEREFGWSESASVKAMEFHAAFGANEERVGGPLNFDELVAAGEVWRQLDQGFRDPEVIANGDVTDSEPPWPTPASEASEIFSRSNRACSDLIEVGQLLSEAKKRLPHGQWVPWLKRELELSDSAAWKLIQVYHVFGSNPEGVTDLKLGVLALSHFGAPDYDA